MTQTIDSRTAHLYTDAHEVEMMNMSGAMYDTLANEYERVVVPVYRPIAKRLIQHIDLRPGWRVLDAGTGTGLIALLAAPRVTKTGQVIGVDASDAMLKIARDKALRFGFTQCEFQMGDLEALRFQDATFDAVLSQFALHHTDSVKSLRELARVLKPGGVLVVQEWMESPNVPNRILNDLLQHYRVPNPSEALHLARQHAERVRDFRINLSQPGVFQTMLEQSGLVGVETRAEEHLIRVANVDAFLEMAMASPALRAELGALPPEVQAQWLNQAREQLGSFETANGFEWVYHVLVGIARRSVNRGAP
jgi:ubiquinone/menaquinone biosynthesis C-methylase UbiE